MRKKCYRQRDWDGRGAQVCLETASVLELSGELSESQAGEEPLHGSPGFLAEAFSFDVIKDKELLKDFTQKSYMIGSGLQHF